MRCVSCSPDAAQITGTGDDEYSLKKSTMSGGSLVIKLLHAYDMLSVGPATPLYGVFRLDSNHPAVKSAMCMSGDNHDCVWDGGQGTGNMDSADCIEVSREDIESHSMLTIEIWRSVMRIFDNMVAAADISLLPLLRYPGVVCERYTASIVWSHTALISAIM